MSAHAEMQQLIMDIAQQSVQDYGESEPRSEYSRVDPDEAEECWKCDDHLARGVKAFEALIYAEELLHMGEAQGRLSFTRENQLLFLNLYEAWLVTGEKAEKWIESLIARERIPENLPRFQEVAALVRIAVTTRKRHRQVILSVNNAKLSKLAESHKPPQQWLDEEDCE